MNLGIVGHGKEKFTYATEVCAKEAIEYAIDLYKPTRIISGRSPVGGIDIWAAEAANARAIKLTEFAPDVKQWNPIGKYGYKARNLDISRNSDLVVNIVIEKYPEGYVGADGLKFDSCYHCLAGSKGKDFPAHVKSGGCWTAWRCKRKRWFIVNATGQCILKYDPESGASQEVPL